MYQEDTLQPEQIELTSSYDFGMANISVGPFPYTEEDRPYLESLNRNIQISQLYKPYSFINGIQVEDRVTENQFYGDPDIQYMLDDYTRFETIADLFIEYIKGVNIRTRNGRKGFYVDSDIKLPSTASVLIDGLPILNLDFALAFDPLAVEKIDIITSMYALNDLRLSGLVSFTTYAGDFDELPVPAYLLEKPYYPIQKVRNFYSPDFLTEGTELHHIPDFRTTLYWTPHVSITTSEKTDISFFTGDDQGKYRYIVLGLTKTGQRILSDGYFEVHNTEK